MVQASRSAGVDNHSQRNVECLFRVRWRCARARWEFVSEVEPVNLQGDRDDIDADILVGDLAKAFKKVQMSVVWHRTMHFGVPK